MSSQPAFCIHCGARLTPGSAFCTSCGQRVADATTPPEVVNAYPPPSPPPPPPPPAGRAPVVTTAPPASRRRSSSRPKAAKAGGNSVGGKIVLTLVGVLLLLMAVRGPVLQVAGATAPGVVTHVTRDTSSEDSDYDYDISYTFTTPDGKQHNGMTTRSNVMNASRLPATGSAVTVRYLPALALVNAPSGEAKLSVGSIVMLVLGVGLMVVAWRR